jgi:hypothetical protein
MEGSRKEAEGYGVGKETERDAEGDGGRWRAPEGNGGIRST